MKWAILNIEANWKKRALPAVTADNVEALYDQLVPEGRHWDAKEELRCSGTETGFVRKVDPMLARHYDCHEVAAEMPDGSWVAWPYWHGGGKYGEPSAITWMADAYDIAHRQEPRIGLAHVFEMPHSVETTA